MVGRGWMGFKLMADGPRGPEGSSCGAVAGTIGRALLGGRITDLGSNGLRAFRSVARAKGDEIGIPPMRETGVVMAGPPLVTAPGTTGGGPFSRGGGGRLVITPSIADTGIGLASGGGPGKLVKLGLI